MQEKLLLHSKKMIELNELEQYIVHESYEQFAEQVLKLQEIEVLKPVLSSGQTLRTPQLFYKYRIEKNKLQQTKQFEIEQLQLQLHEQLSLDYYYRLPFEQFKRDRPWIEKINHFFHHAVFPLEPAPAPERSQMLVGDEKWIQNSGGQQLLERLGIYEQLAISTSIEPLWMAINRHSLFQKTQYHLIVENKATYEGLLAVLPETCFSSLIYGGGYGIVGSLPSFERQLPLQDVHSIFYYFGDLDFVGISIWHALTEQRSIQLAVPFYTAALNNEGKRIPTKQLKNKEAIFAFLQAFTEADQQTIRHLLQRNYYLSQEVLSAHQLQHIWLKMSERLKGGQ